MYCLQKDILLSKSRFVEMFGSVNNSVFEKKTAEVKAMIETYNKQVDFVDFNSLDSIIQEL